MNTTQPQSPGSLHPVVGRRFPIMRMHTGGTLPEQVDSIPWELIAPHEAQAQRNHCQTLQRLAERGGLAPCEAVAVIEDADYRKRWPETIYSREEMDAHNTAAILRLRELCETNKPSNI